MNYEAIRDDRRCAIKTRESLVNQNMLGLSKWRNDSDKSNDNPITDDQAPSVNKAGKESTSAPISAATTSHPCEIQRPDTSAADTESKKATANLMQSETPESLYGRPEAIPFINDRPSDKPSEDFTGYAAALAALVNSGEKATDNTPLTIGIFAPWGSGKSTLLKALRNRIQESDRKNRCIIVNFNAWHQENNQQLAASMLYSMGNAVAENGKTSTASDEDTKDKDFHNRLETLLTSTGQLITKSVITTLKKGNFTFQMPFSLGAFSFSANDSEDSSMTDDQSVDPLIRGLNVSSSDQLSKNLDAISSLLNENNKRLIVMIDDLDRCNSKELVQAVETISMLSDRSGMVFILALDHNQIIKALKHEYGNQMDGEKYLEKIIQIPFWIPSNGLANKDEENNPIKELIGTDWEKLEKDNWINDNLTEGIRFIVQGPLRSNPRQTKRFLNTFLLLSYIYWDKLHDPNDEADTLKNFTYFLGMQVAWPGLQSRLIRNIDDAENNSSASTFEKLTLVKEICDANLTSDNETSPIEMLNQKFNIGLTSQDDLENLQNYLTFSPDNPYQAIGKMKATSARDLIRFAVTGTDAEDDADKIIKHVDMSNRDSSKWYWDDGKKKYTKHQLLRLIGKRYQEERNFAKKEEFEAAFAKEITKCMQDTGHAELIPTFYPELLLDVDDKPAAEQKLDFHINDSDQAYSIDWWCGFKPGPKAVGERVHRPLIEYFQEKGYPIRMA